MAVSVQTQLYTASLWNIGESQASLDLISDAPAAPMSYQYPSLGSSGIDPISNIAQSYHHQTGDDSPSNPSSFANAPSPGLRDQDGLGTTKSGKVKRAMSTPNVRGQASADAAALNLSSEKRRNKLGYHRTSVACGHCRRRKIRCIPAPADPQSRCSNCIRLKKECNFYPVDQQPQVEPNRRSSKAMSGTGASETSSPATSSGQLPDMQPSLPYPHMNMPSIQDLGGPQMKRQRTESFSPESKVVTSSRNFEYGHGGANWMAPEASPGVKSHPELPPPDLQTPYWRMNHQESPITPAFSPFTPSHQIPPLQTWSNNHPEPSPREDLSWSVPQRSISYSNLEGIQNHHQNPPYASHPQSHPISDHYTTKPRLQHTGMYPPPISTSAGNHPPTEYSPAATSESAQQSQSAGVLPPVNYSQWQQPYSYQKPVGSSSEHYGSWNQTHGPPSVPEGHAQPVHYGYAASGSYYPPPPDQGR